MNTHILFLTMVTMVALFGGCNNSNKRNVSVDEPIKAFNIDYNWDPAALMVLPSPAYDCFIFYRDIGSRPHFWILLFRRTNLHRPTSAGINESPGTGVHLLRDIRFGTAGWQLHQRANN